MKGPALKIWGSTSPLVLNAKIDKNCDLHHLLSQLFTFWIYLMFFPLKIIKFAERFTLNSYLWH